MRFFVAPLTCRAMSDKPLAIVTEGSEQTMSFHAQRLILAAALGLGLSSPALSQETPPPGDGAPEAPAAESPATEDATTETPPAPAQESQSGEGQAGASQGGEGQAGDAQPGSEPSSGDPAAGEPREIVRDTFGDWQVRCATDTNECFMYQLALDEANNPVAEVSLLKLPAGGEAAAGATVVSPLGTLLTTGVALQVDTNPAQQYPFNWCSQVGCFARFGMTEEAINAFKRGGSGKLSLVSIAQPNRPITLNLSLTGFTAAYDLLETPVGAPVPATPTAPRPAPTMPSLAPSNN